MTVRVRFAPSPTGMLHIGGARTALFNYLFARANDGVFLLRIEDTDKARSTDEAISAIYEGLTWLGLAPDEPAVMQSTNHARHTEIVRQLLDTGHAYKCFATQEELAQMRSDAEKQGRAFRYDGRWRDRPESDALDAPYAVRLKAPQSGHIVIHDAVQGAVSIDCAELDDMIILRSDGTPTYLLAVVVDDFDMGITHILRGDDHFTNSFRQAMIYNALGWTLPSMAHVPLIHGADGAKLSKRHGALGVMEYQKMGYLPQALRNYLLRLGWSHGDDEIISDEEAIEWFSFEGLGKSPARFDMAKLDSLNGHYIREENGISLCALALPFIEDALQRSLTPDETKRLPAIIATLRERAQTLVELAENSLFYFALPAQFSDKAMKLLAESQDMLPAIITHLQKTDDWMHDALMAHCTLLAEHMDVKLGKIMQPVRAALTGSHASPSMFDIMAILGKAETLRRLEKALQ